VNEQHTHLDDIKSQSSKKGKDKQTRTLLIVLVVLWLLTLAALIGVAWNAYFKEKEKTQTLAQQISFACDSGDFGEGLSPEDVKALCENAQEVIEENDPELQDEEIQEAEIQDPEIQDPEDQNPETQDPESQDRENQDPESQDAEDQESEEQDPEIQDEETQDPEIQDPEVDDPDPNDDDVRSGECTFDGIGTITFTLQTDSGPVTFSCTGTMTPPGQQ